VLLAGDVEEEVGGEGEELLADEHEEGVDGGVAEILFVVDVLARGLLGDGEVGARLGDVAGETR
jgi:hypothetical protein